MLRTRLQEPMQYGIIEWCSRLVFFRGLNLTDTPGRLLGSLQGHVPAGTMS